MLFSYKLLTKLVDLSSIDVDSLVKKLTFSGFEVESYHQLAKASNLVVGKVIQCQNHPESDHLHILKVDIGSEVLDIVCGAKNVKTGVKVIVAKIGAKLPAINAEIKPTTLLNYPSNGMCCSLVELGVEKRLLSEEDLNGIHILDDNAKIGDENVLSYLGLDDYVLDINILPNRPDCLSHLGLAREIASLFERKLYSIPSFDFENKISSYQVESLTSKCQKFSLVEIKVSHNIPSPISLVSYLRTCGIRSISLIVDIGNFSMLLTGQPLHMYDLDKLDGNKLVVRDDYEGEFIALDGKSYHIKKDDLIICDSKKPCCLAGVNGAKAVEVDASTTHIGIEAANFNGVNIRHTSNRLGLVSDSSLLFTKGVNPYLIDENMDVTMMLFKQYLPDFKYIGRYVYSTIEDLSGCFDFSVNKLNHHLGSSFDVDKVKKSLDSFNLKYDLNQLGEGKIYKNKYRLDLLEQCDIDEEIFRTNSTDASLYKYDIKAMPTCYASLDSNQMKEKLIRESLVNLGLYQIISFSLISKKQNESLRGLDLGESYKIINPLTEEHLYVRSDLLSSMVEVLNYNLARKHEDLALFEISSVSSTKGDANYLSIGLHGKRHMQDSLNLRSYDFYDMKGYIENIMNILSLDERRYKLVRSSNSIFHPYKSADIYIGKDLVGSFGEVNPKYYKEGYILGELNLTKLFAVQVSKLKCKPLSNLQPIRRDIALKLLSNDVKNEQIVSEIKRLGGKYVQSVEIFDVFTKDNETSYAYAIYLLKEDKSFLDSEIAQIMNNIITGLQNKLKVELKS